MVRPVRIVSGHQPNYLPWSGYLDKIMRCDDFVIHDVAQFEKQGYFHRNRIKTASGPQWLTVPVSLDNYLERPLHDIEIRRDLPWRRTHLRGIQTAYGRAPFFARYHEFFAALYDRDWTHLVELNLYIIRFALAELGIPTRIHLVSELSGITGKKSDFVLSLCQRLGATHYLVGGMGRDYLHADRFARAGIEIIDQDYHCPTYEQRFGAFVPDLSFVDLLMNHGPASGDLLRHRPGSSLARPAAAAASAQLGGAP
jgi:hypothetical protein